MFTFGNSLFACGFEEACGETEVGRRRLPLPPAPRLLSPRMPVTNRTQTWTSNLRGHYFAWNWTIPVVMLTTVVATTVTLSSNSCKSTIVFYTFYFCSAEKVHREWHVSYKQVLALKNSQLVENITWSYFQQCHCWCEDWKEVL